MWRLLMGLTAAALMLALGLAAAASAGARCGRPWQAPKRASDHALRTSVLCLVNGARERRGIAPLRYSEALRRSASAHSKAMVRSGILSHYGPGGSTPSVRIVRSGYPARVRTLRMAENIAAGVGRSNGSPAAIVRSWMNSATHKSNILARGLRDFGVGVARGGPFGGDRNAATYTLDLASPNG
jgi:uncharacterized protein YkwD